MRPQLREASVVPVCPGPEPEDRNGGIVSGLPSGLGLQGRWPRQEALRCELRELALGV